MSFDIETAGPRELVDYRLDESREYTEAWREQARLAYEAYHNGVVAPLVLENFPLDLRPPTMFNRVNAAAIQLLPASSGLIWNIPRIVRQGTEDTPHKALNEKATYTENVVRSGMPMLFRNARETVPLEVAKHALIAGWGVLWTGYDASLRLPKPTGRSVSAEDLEEWEEARRRYLPYRCESRDPRNLYPSPGDEGQTYMITLWEDVPLGRIARQYGWRPAETRHGWEKERRNVIEYRDTERVYRMVQGEDPMPKWSGRHWGQGTGFSTFGTGIGTSDGSFLERHYGLGMMALKCGLFEMEALFFKLLCATMAYSTVPKPVVDPRLAGTDWRPGTEVVLQTQLAPDEDIRRLVTWFVPPTPPDMAVKVLQLVKGELSEATINELVASGEIASDTAATYLTALQESKAKLNATRDGLEEAFAEAGKIFVRGLRSTRLNKDDDAYDFIAERRAGQQPLAYSREKLLAYPAIEVTCDPVGPQQRASDLRTGLELEKSSGVPQIKINEEWFHSDDPEQDYYDKQAELLIQGILTNPQQQDLVRAGAYLRWYATHPNDGKDFETWDAEDQARQQAEQQAAQAQQQRLLGGGVQQLGATTQQVVPTGPAIDPMQMQAGLAGPGSYQFNPMPMPGSPEEQAQTLAQQEQALLEANGVPPLPRAGAIPAPRNF